MPLIKNIVHSCIIVTIIVISSSTTYFQLLEIFIRTGYIVWKICNVFKHFVLFTGKQILFTENKSLNKLYCLQKKTNIVSRKQMFALYFVYILYCYFIVLHFILYFVLFTENKSCLVCLQKTYLKIFINQFSFEELKWNYEIWCIIQN